MSLSALEQMRDDLGASAVIVLGTAEEVSEALLASPASLTGLTWPRVPLADGVVTDDGAMAGLLPASVWRRIGPPSALAVSPIEGDVLLLIVAWGQAVPADPMRAIGARLRSGLDVVLATAAGREVAARQRDVLASVLSALDSAVVRIDSERGEVTYNAAAGELLGLRGDARASDVSQAMLSFQARASNPDEAAAVARSLERGEPARGVLRFDQPPTHVKVSAHDDGHGGRVWVFDDVSTEYALVAKEQQARRQLRITTDAMLDPQVLLGPVRDADGEVVDFVYVDVNAACSSYLGIPREELIGSSVEESMPQLRESGLTKAYAEVLRTGEPLVLDEFAFYNAVLADQRWYDIRAARAGDGLTLTWRDVTHRAEDARILQQSQERLAATIDSMLTPHLMLAAVRDAAGALVDLQIRNVNAAAADYLNVDASRLVGLSLRRALREEQFRLLFAWCREVLDGTGRVEYDDVRFPAEDSVRHPYLDVKVVRVGEEVSFAFQDVTQRHEMTERIAQSEEHYRLLAHNSSDVVVLIREGVVGWSSPALTPALGWTPPQWQDNDFLSLVDPADREAADEHLRQVARGATEVVTVRMADSAGEPHWVELHSSPFLDDAGRQVGVVTSFRVVDEEVAEEAELAQQARIDPLTGLVNRREAVAFLRAALVEALANRSRVGVLFCDIDRFKTINDQFGHAGGDEVLKALAQRLRGNVRSLDAVARMGGDELVVILPGVRDVDRLQHLANHLHGQASRPVRFGNDRIPVTVSVGGALAEEGERADQLIARADAAMYEAKRAGRHRVVIIT